MNQVLPFRLAHARQIVAENEREVAKRIRRMRLRRRAFRWAVFTAGLYAYYLALEMFR